MCEFCEDQKTIMEIDVISPSTVSFYGGVKTEDADKLSYRSGVFIDTRGYLRLVDLEDCNCIEAGVKVGISFCPFCGKKIEREE